MKSIKPWYNVSVKEAINNNQKYSIMKKSNQFLLLVGLFLMSVSLTYAQGPHKRPGMNHLKDLKSELNLSDEQSKAFDEALMENRNAIKKIREDETIAPEEKRSQINELRAEHKEKVATILTEEQKVKMQEVGQQRKADQKELAAERKEVRKEKMSDLRTIRKEFDAKIAPQDKAKINAFKEKRAAHKAEMKQIKKEDKELRKEKMQDFHDATASERAELNTISKKYEAEIEAIMSEQKMERKEGQKMEKMDKKGKMDKMDKKHKKGPKRDHDKGEMNKSTHFLLMDFEK